MQTRSIRITILTLLLAAPLAAASFLWTTDRRAAAAARAADAVAAHVDRMRDAIAEIGTAQQGYVAPGQLDEPWFEWTTEQIQALRTDISAVHSLLRSTEGPGTLAAFAESVDALEAADARTRENLGIGQDLMAADVIFSDGRNILEGMVERLRELQRAERASTTDALGSVARARWGALAVLILAPFTIVALLRKVPGGAAVAAVSSGAAATAPGSVAPGAPAPAPRPLDLAAAAALCTDLGRVSATAALPPLLARAAELLNASGLTLWMSAGEQLFAVLGHGYAAADLARFGPIARHADNAVAAAWRAGRVSVMAGGAQTPGALAAPMFGPGGCVGVLALEIRPGHEPDHAAQAVATMVAAQLAAVVAAWPAASNAPAAPKADVRSA